MKNSINLTRRDALKLGAGALAAGVPAVLAGCGSDAAVQDGSGAKKSYKVALVVSGPEQDRGWAQSHYDAIKAGCAALGNWQMVETQENTSAAASADLVQSYVDQGIDLIVAAGTQFASAWGDVVSNAAKKKPEVKFLLTNVDPASDLAGYETLENVECVQVDYEQIGSLAGVVAGLMTRTNNIGFVGGAELTSTTAKYEAYVAAAKKVNASVEGFYDYGAGFSEATEGRRVAKQLIGAHDIDVMWSDASAADNGVRQALQDAGEDSHFDIAQPRDLAGEATVIASTVINWPIKDAMTRIADGSFGKGAIVVANMSNGDIALGKLSDAIPEDVRAKIEDYASQIEKGTF